MLGNILTNENCAQCRICCVFDRYDLWETPVIPDEMKRSLEELDPSIEFVSKGNAWLFRMSESDDGLYYCPMLTETGCKLGKSKPFECSVWPYRVMSLDGRRVISMASICPTMYRKPLDKLVGELENGLAEAMFREADRLPEMIKEYTEGYPILKVE